MLAKILERSPSSRPPATSLRIPNYRPHAQNVQSERTKETMTNLPGLEYVIEVTY